MQDTMRVTIGGLLEGTYELNAAIVAEFAKETHALGLAPAAAIEAALLQQANQCEQAMDYVKYRDYWLKNHAGRPEAPAPTAE